MDSKWLQVCLGFEWIRQSVFHDWATHCLYISPNMSSSVESCYELMPAFGLLTRIAKQHK